MSYWVYENWVVRPRKAILHVGSCRFCNEGRGLTGGTDPQRGGWHGPFDNIGHARQVSAQLERVTDRRDCRHCAPA